MENDSILTSVKQYLNGLTEDNTAFDSTILEDINLSFAILSQLGVGPKDGFYVDDKNTKWSNFVEDKRVLSLSKTFVNVKTKLLFDPPTSSAAIEALNTILSETEWRLINGDVVYNA